MRGKVYAGFFVAFSVLDMLTTWFGVSRGLSEANPVIAQRLSDPILFFGSFALFTALGVALILVTSALTGISGGFRYFPAVFVLFKAAPAVNNLYLLFGREFLIPTIPVSLLVAMLIVRPEKPASARDVRKAFIRSLQV
ncbi:DUF5658 family protein [Thermococcus sp. 21S7]|uniref:DUF5658 family protein n=1 Tax=Thermococcus sp. 21S7 TaxID=1638221 RepID=UPI001F11806C|nr:DUF5658 family protein [Thermococcus sp. 21S7]